MISVEGWPKLEVLVVKDFNWARYQLWLVTAEESGLFLMAFSVK